MTDLPNKLSDLLDLALVDLRRVEADPTYGVKMEFWHCKVDGCCSVCLAGAVLAKTVGLSIYKQISSHNIGELDCYGTKLSVKMQALDDVRRSDVRSALRRMGQDTLNAPSTGYVPPYGQPGFYEALDAIALKLREVGL